MGCFQMRYAKYIIFWLSITAGIALVYDVNHKALQSTRATAVTVAPSAEGALGVSFRKSNDGHFYILAHISGENIKFLVDTGATDVVLSFKDAQRIGAHMRPSKSKTYRTANGSIQASYFTIPEIRIGNLVARNVGASVSTSQLETSLLGMSFLKNFQFIMKKDELILYQN